MPLSRRELLKALGFTTVGASLSHSALGSLLKESKDASPNPSFRPSDRLVTAIVAGAGSRGNTYSPYSEKYPSRISRRDHTAAVFIIATMTWWTIRS